MTWADVVAQAARALLQAGVPDAARDARKLMALACGIAPDRVSLYLRDTPKPLDRDRFDQILGQRLVRRPMAQIQGRRDFFRHSFRVTGDVLDPRPETETLVTQALADPFGSVLDLGTGSGCILLSLLAARPGARGTGTDVSAAALRIAAHNAHTLGLPDRVTLIESDWFAGVEGRFDLIVSNPPYIAQGEMAGLAPELAFEPPGALTDGADGLSAYRAIAAGVGDHLTQGGRLMVEIGPTQAGAVSEIFAQAGLHVMSVCPDLDGRDRVISAAIGDLG